MTPARLAPPTAGRATTVARAVAGFRPPAARSVPRPMRITPSLRPPEPPLSPSRRDVLRRWEEWEEWSCAYCDSSFTEMVVAEVDHIRPLARGGVHEWFNLAPACAWCNRLKSDRDVAEWVSQTAGDSLAVHDGTVT
ncbi:HNH endonuclease [Streptomyces hawaiiensis]|uniref:HNH endonuclease n=1 Tax=Streptomyces hawaiiensis TaxID=67305 RepID=UPI00364CFF81